MTFVFAFLCGGILCALAQLVQVLAKLELPLPVLIGSILLGGVLGVFGVVPMLEEVCQAGMMATAVDAGFGIQAGVMSAMAGNPAPLLIMLGTLTSVIVMGVISGTIASNRMIKNQK